MLPANLPWYPKTVLGISAALALALLLVRPLRAWALRVDIRWLVGFHLTRFVGVYFLYLYAQHELPHAFAVWGGFGDIVVAILALFVMYFACSTPLLIGWNILAFADIVAVAATAVRSEMAAPGSMHQLDRLPLILLPTLVVPVVIVTHVLMLVRAYRTAG
jgi:hypothetical protein